MQPVIKGYIPYTALKDGGVNLYDLYILNELISYQSDFESMVHEDYRKTLEAKNA